MFFNNRIILSAFLDEIQKELESGHFLAALIMSLMIPDICAGENARGKGYRNWVEKYYNQHSYISDDFNANIIYKLRCNILHSAKTYKNISLRYNSESEYHLGHLLMVIRDRATGKETRVIGLNINEFAEEMILSAKKFIEETKEDPFLFSIIDYDKIDGQSNDL